MMVDFIIVIIKFIDMPAPAAADYHLESK